MKKVILIGDSIRLGYDKYVKESLAGTCEVYSPEENCRFAEYVLRYLHEWKNTGKWPGDADLVHWNAGLWDVLRLFDDEPMTPKTAYGELILRIHKRIRMLFPNAKIIFANSTSIVEAGYKSSFKRYNSDIEEYNKIAENVLSGLDCEINDLYSLSVTVPPAARSDMTHFNTPLGADILGGRVVKLICDALDISEDTLAKANNTPNKISDKNLGY